MDHLNNHITFDQQEAPTAKDWEDALDGMPIERVNLNQNGTVNKEKSPTIYDWLRDDDFY